MISLLLSSLLASSAILTAVFIAISGLPLFVRVAAIVLTFLLVTGTLPALIRGCPPSRVEEGGVGNFPFVFDR